MNIKAIILLQEIEEDVVRSAAEHCIKEHGKTKKDTVRLIETLKGFVYTMDS
jgi:hypothetical protein